MLERIAFGVVLASLCAPALGQRWGNAGGNGGSSYQAASDDSADMTESAADDPDLGPDPDENVPADLLSDGPDGDSGGDANDAAAAPAPAKLVAPEDAPGTAPADSSAAPTAGDDGDGSGALARVARREEETSAPDSRDAAVALVAEACHSERGLFCNAVRTDDLKSARCLLQNRDSVLDDCARALDAAKPLLSR